MYNTSKCVSLDTINVLISLECSVILATHNPCYCVVLFCQVHALNSARYTCTQQDKLNTAKKHMSYMKLYNGKMESTHVVVSDLLIR